MLLYVSARVGLGALVVTWLLSCGSAAPPRHSSPEYEAALRQVCEVDALAGLDPESNLIGIEGERHDWMMENVKEPDLIELVTLLRVEGEARRAQMLREALRGTRVQSCSLERHYAALAAHSPAPAASATGQ